MKLNLAWRLMAIGGMTVFAFNGLVVAQNEAESAVSSPGPSAGEPPNQPSPSNDKASKAVSQDPSQGKVIDSFEETQGWTTFYSENGTIKLSAVPGKDGQALQIDFDTKGANQWVLVSKDVAGDASFKDLSGKAFQFQVRSQGGNNNFLEVKLLDKDGSIYANSYPLTFSDTWETMTVKLTDLTYWSGGDKNLGEIDKLQFAVSGGNGAKGTVILDDLLLIEAQ